MRFANMVNILPFRNPLLVAEEAAMLDNLTGGRHRTPMSLANITTACAPRPRFRRAEETREVVHMEPLHRDAPTLAGY